MIRPITGDPIELFGADDALNIDLGEEEEGPETSRPLVEKSGEIVSSISSNKEDKESSKTES